MDPLTQAVLGGALAQAACHRRIGRAALVCGAIGGAFPDVDVFFSSNQWEAWATHRGVTHSLFFPFVAAAPLGLAIVGIERAWRRIRPSERTALPVAGVILATFLGLITHALLDFMTPYGTQLLSPFSNERFAVSGISIIDPIYTLPLLFAVIYGWSRGRPPERIRTVAIAALIFSQLYLGLNLIINWRVEHVARRQLEAEGATQSVVKAYPTIFQGVLRRVVVKEPDTIRVGFYTVLSHQQIRWRSFPRAEHPVQERFLRSDVGQLFQWFSMGNISFIVEDTGGATVLQAWDIRYGLPDHPRKGMWGVQALYDAAGQQLEPPRPIRIDRTSNLGQNLVRLWWGVVGDARGGFH